MRIALAGLGTALIIFYSIGDSLFYHNNSEFSTKDKDSKECAETSNGAWWYNLCHLSNLNGFNYNWKSGALGKGIIWSTWRSKEHSMRDV